MSTKPVHTLPFETCAVGDKLPVLERPIDLTTLVRYAGASGDYNPIHHDEAYARAAGLDGVIGHGMLAMGLASEAVSDWVGDSGLVSSISVRFASPSRLGDRLIVSGEIVERTETEGRVLLRVDLSCTNQEGTEILRDATATLRSR